MKNKLIALLLLLSLLTVGCATTVENVSDGGSSTEESQAVQNEEWKQTVQKIDALYGEKAERSGKTAVLLSKGATVTASRKGSGDMKHLTDGAFFEKDDVSKAVKFQGNDELALVIDLGKVTEGICDVGVGLFYSSAKKASVPKTVNFYVSDDGENYTPIGSYQRPTTLLNNSGNYMEIRLQNCIAARYVKLEITAEVFTVESILIDEFYVNGYGEAGDNNASDSDVVSDEYYKNTPLPEVTENIYWDSSEADYTKEINLVAKKSYRIKSDLKIDTLYKTDYYNSPTTNRALTDGRKGGASFGDGAYFHFTRFLSRTVYFDLEKVSGVSSVTVGFLLDAPTGITLSDSVAVLASMDGKRWGKVAEGTPTTKLNGTHRVEFKLDFDKTEARFVAVRLGVNSHLWVDEISVFGTKDASGAKEIDYSEDTREFPNEYLSTDALGGIQNIMLAYTFKNENPAAGLNTVEEFLPYVGYHNKNNEIVDTFFDSFLFLACSTVCPSGGRLYYYPQAPARASDWIAYEDDLFAEDANVSALSEAVGIVNEKLNRDEKMSVFFPIYSTVYGDKNFGDIDGEIKNVNFERVEDRKKVIKWWIDKLVARINSGEYENLRLDGFYWNHESMETSDPHELELVHFTADYLHSLGYYFIWIPYYQSTGFMNWRSYGFDAAVMQPNYMFNDDVPEERLYDNAYYTKLLGLGVEIEADFGVASDKAKREKYRDYLRVGVETGYMHSIKMYYQDAGPGVFYKAYKSTDPYFHSVYDDTYLYAKGKLSFDMPELLQTTFTGPANKSVSIIPKSKADNTIIDVVVAESPKYGSVRVANNGRVYYYPMDGFVGEDSFVIRGEDNPNDPGVVITVIIEEAQE